MELVLDANILFAALIKSGKTREILLNDELTLFAPEFLISEFTDHLGELENKTGLEEKKLEELFERITENNRNCFLLVVENQKLLGIS